MSTVIVSRGRVAKSSQVKRADLPPGPRSVRSHADSGACGVGPADNTGKSRVSYWPGGRRAANPSAGRRPRNPRAIRVIVLHPRLVLAPLSQTPRRRERGFYIVETHRMARISERPVQSEIGDLLPAGVRERIVGALGELQVRCDRH